MKISIIGGGALGSALAFNYAFNQKKVCLWNRTTITTEELFQRHQPINKNILDHLDIKQSIAETVKDSDAILICIKAQAVYNFLREYSSFLISKPVVFCSKGIDSENLLLQTELGEKTLKKTPLAVLTGPGFASDILAQKPIALTLACKDKETSNTIQALLSTSSIRPYLSSDIIGAQVGGALKNVIAIACGITEGKDLGVSARTAIMTRGFTEINKIGLALGCESETLIGLSGLGDLTLTCNSIRSRNFNYGKELALERLKKDNNTIEGKGTAAAAYQIANHFGLDVPIIKSVFSVIKGTIGIDEAITSLLSRPLKSEMDH